jgi:hypothetical protein
VCSSDLGLKTVVSAQNAGPVNVPVPYLAGVLTHAFKFAGVFKRMAEIANLACVDKTRELRRQNQTNVRIRAWRVEPSRVR